MQPTLARDAADIVLDIRSILMRTPPGADMPAADADQIRRQIAQLQEILRGIEGGIRGAISWLRHNRLLPQINREFGPLVLAQPNHAE